MIELSPQAQFLQLEDTSRAFGNVANHPSVQTAITYALSEYAIKNKPSAEQLAGVQDFVQIFLNMAEKAKPLAKFPQKRLVAEKPSDTKTDSTKTK